MIIVGTAGHVITS